MKINQNHEFRGVFGVEDYVRRVLLAIPASNMKADNETDAEKQDLAYLGAVWRPLGLEDASLLSSKGISWV